jgi:hypothetical protein
MDANWTFTGAYATNSSIATGGRLIGGAPFLPAPYASGTTFSFLVRGWSSTIAGQDWPTTQAFMNNIESDPIAFGSQGQLFGTSGIASLVVGGTPGPVPPIFGTIPGVSIQGFVLDQVPIPEPSVFALAGFGITGVLVSHRRFRVREAEHGLSRNDP